MLWGLVIIAILVSMIIGFVIGRRSGISQERAAQELRRRNNQGGGNPMPEDQSWKRPDGTVGTRHDGPSAA